MDSVLMKRPSDYFIEPKRRKKNSYTKVLAQDSKYAEIDEFSEVEVDPVQDSDCDVESIVGFYGGITPLKQKEGEVDEADDENEEENEYDEMDIFSDEEDDNVIENGADTIIKMEVQKRLQDEDFRSKINGENPNIQVEFVDGFIVVRNELPKKMYTDLIQQIVKSDEKLRATLLENRVDYEWETSQITKMKKEISKAKAARDEMLKNAELLWVSKVERGDFRKMNCIRGNVYTEVYSPVARETETLVDLIGKGVEADLELSDNNMELTLERGEVESDNAIESDMELDNIDNEDESEDEEEKNLVNTETVEPTADTYEPKGGVHMDLTDLDLPKQTRDDDEESTWSDLDFVVSDDIKRLYKLYNIPIDLLRMIFGSNKKTVDTSEIDSGNKFTNEENNENEEIEEEEDDVDQEEDEEEQPESAETIVEDNDENNPGCDHHYKAEPGDTSSTAGSVLSEIQNTPAVRADHVPPPQAVAMRPSDQVQRRRIVLSCVGIPRDKLHTVKIVMVPATEVMKAYQKVDEELYKLSQEPNGSLMTNEDLIARLMQRRHCGTLNQFARF